MNSFYLETEDGIIRDETDFMTPDGFLEAYNQGSLHWSIFPPKCILNDFLVSEIELYDIINNPDKEDRLFTTKELEFREKNRKFGMDDIFYAFSFEHDEPMIDIADYNAWKNRHKEWCLQHTIIKRNTAACPADKEKKEISPHAKKSYLTIIAALCNKNHKLDINSRNAVSIIQAEIDKIGLSLGEDTIRKIVKEVRTIINE